MLLSLELFLETFLYLNPQYSFMQKRGSSVSVLFTVIIAAVSVILIGIFAAKAATAMIKTSERTTILKVSEEIKAFVDSTANGQKKTAQFSIPNNVIVCIADTSVIPPSTGLSNNFPLIASSLKAGTKDNLFFVNQKKDVILQTSLGDIRVNGPGYLCEKAVNGNFELSMEGKGFDIGVAETFQTQVTQAGVPVQIGTGETQATITLGAGGTLTNPPTFTLQPATDQNQVSDTVSIEGTIPANTKITLPLPVGVHCSDPAANNIRFQYHDATGDHILPASGAPPCANDQLTFTLPASP